MGYAVNTVTIAVVSLVVSSQITACKPRTESSLASAGSGQQDSLSYQKEIIPYNRVQTDRMKTDEETFRTQGWRFPARTEVQMHEGKSYGIRVIDPEHLDLFVRPGDIAVDYQVMTDLRLAKFDGKIEAVSRKVEVGEEKPTGFDDQMLVMLGEQGMTHAKIVIEDQGKLCHVDSPDEMSSCAWDGYQHFFRVDTDEKNAEKAANMAKQLSEKWGGSKRIEYDSLLVTDICTQAFTSVDRTIKKALVDGSSPLPPMYCSELPFVFHSVVAGKPMFTRGYNLIEFAEQIAKLKSVPAFAPFVSDEKMQKSLIAFIQQASAVNENMRPIVTTGVRQLLSDGMMGSSLRFLAKQFYPSVIFPKNYMIAAKDPQALPGARIVYIGSIETKSPNRDVQYYSTMLANVSTTVYRTYLERVREWWSGKDGKGSNNPVAPSDDSQDSDAGGDSIDSEVNGNSDGGSDL